MAKPTFYVGLTMAGAISAGAYSGGVFDFLMEALDEWSKRKKQLDGMAGTMRDVPSHDVIIPVITGASAGAITGALGVVALAECDDTKAAESIVVRGARDIEVNVNVRLRRLYDAWVTTPSFVSDDGNCLLGTKDLDAKDQQGKSKRLQSLLDTTVLDDIVNLTFTGITKIAVPRDYLAPDLRLFVTHTNIRGVPYNVDFTNAIAGQPGYPMMCHADWRHFLIADIGFKGNDGDSRGQPFASTWARDDLSENVSVTTLKGMATLSTSWTGFAEAAVGSGAFPVGLRARTITKVTVGGYKTRPWAFARTIPPSPDPIFTLPPAYPTGFDRAADYVTLDGGTINNEPFELARWTLMAKPPEQNPRAPKEADRAVIMIDPFPEAPDFDALGALDTALLPVIKKLLPALLNQARFKPAELAAALDEGVASRYLIAPRRKLAAADPDPQPYGIACGLLSGFGGFLNKQFRAHDYQLGRLNCYLFLKSSFGLPAANPIIETGYAIAADAAGKLVSPIKRTNADGSSDDYTMDGSAPGERYYQIIPLYGSAATMPTAPTWPYATKQDVDKLVERAKIRADKIVERLAAEGASFVMRWGVQAIWSAVGKGALETFVRWTVLRQLILRDQLDDYATQGAPHDERKVIAALANTSYDYYTAARIAAESGVVLDTVKDTLNKYKGKVKSQVNGAVYNPIVSSDGPRVDEGGNKQVPSYGLTERERSGFWTLPGLKWVAESTFQGEPTVGRVG